MKKVLLIDNYDSFTYTLKQYFEYLGVPVLCYYNDQIDFPTVADLNPQYVVISPGPGHPNQAGISLNMVQYCYEKNLPLLGVCLGHQAIGQFFGAKIIQAPEILHGKNSDIAHTQRGLFQNLPNPFQATRYHSLVIDPHTLPSCLSKTAWVDSQPTLMGLSHKTHPIVGVQFHPEAVQTKKGRLLLSNFLLSSSL